MTPDDRLRGAARALRGEDGVDPVRSAASRAAIVRTVRRRKSQRRSVGLAAAALSVCLVGSTVWGAATGRISLSRVWQGVVSSMKPSAPPRAVPWPVRGFAVPHVTVAPISTPTVEQVVTDPAPGVSVVATTGTTAPPVHLVVSARAHVRPGMAAAAIVAPVVVHEAPAVSPTAIAPAAPAVAGVDPSEAIFRAAQHADFEAHDTVAALAAWESYLRADPSGRFAPEATYNRALDLVRLGRGHEAIAALRPFAEGTYGTYRRREASQLIDALTSRESSGRP